MTRRERHQRILDSFGNDRVRRALQEYTTKDILAFLSDEGVEAITRRIVTNHKRQQRWNAEHRARFAARVA